MSDSVVSATLSSDGILLLKMEDKANKNMFSEELVSQLKSIFREIERNEDVRVVILTGYDTYFSSGGLQKSLLAIQKGETSFVDIGLYNLALECRYPVISAMQGHAIGGGLVMGLFSDFIILSRESVYSANFMKYGFTPGMGATQIIPKKFGTVLGVEMLMTGNQYRGGELESRGIGMSVFPRQEVLPRAIELAQSLVQLPVNSLAILKNNLTLSIRKELAGTIKSEIEMHDQTFRTDDVKKRITESFGVVTADE